MKKLTMKKLSKKERIILREGAIKRYTEILSERNPKVVVMDAAPDFLPFVVGEAEEQACRELAKLGSTVMLKWMTGKEKGTTVLTGRKAREAIKRELIKRKEELKKL